MTRQHWIIHPFGSEQLVPVPHLAACDEFTEIPGVGASGETRTLTADPSGQLMMSG